MLKLKITQERGFFKVCKQVLFKDDISDSADKFRILPITKTVPGIHQVLFTRR